MNTTEFKLDENTFFIRRMDPFKALSVLGTLQKRLLLPLVEVMKVQEADSEAGAKEALAKAVAALSENIDGDALVTMAKLLLDPAYVSIRPDGETQPKRLTEGEINTHLPSVADIFLLCVEVVKVNYADFGKRAATLIGAARSQTVTFAQ